MQGKVTYHYSVHMCVCSALTLAPIFGQTLIPFIAPNNISLPTYALSQRKVYQMDNPKDHQISKNSKPKCVPGDSVQLRFFDQPLPPTHTHTLPVSNGTFQNFIP